MKKQKIPEIEWKNVREALEVSKNESLLEIINKK